MLVKIVTYLIIKRRWSISIWPEKVRRLNFQTVAYEWLTVGGGVIRVMYGRPNRLGLNNMNNSTCKSKRYSERSQCENGGMFRV